ncbi:MAG: sensor histidine kinase KdpD [Gammaproteobacteria bacterium]|nr:sensor histidine kinase KdpD [Gammaproteobacteria bacterium]
MPEQRPDPDALLARVQADEAKARRGSLKIFFGMCPGVGKTYTMLQAGQARRAEGVDLVIGIVETHKRSETAALTEGLEQLHRRSERYRGHTLYEFDLDAALARRPALILVDELAHTNLSSCRHAKRWQDVEELLAAGIDVYTTVNVQHLESVNDQVGRITGVRVQETFPDRVFEAADEVELVDLPPDELLQRLAEGKVYLAEQAERAGQHFFRKGNLIALRELALRRVAERVDAQMRDYRERHGIAEVWALSDQLLVALGPTPDAENLVRAGKRLASALNATWTVAYVETPKLQAAPREQRESLLKALALAESLGAETVTLAGPLVSAEILGYAQARNIGKLLLGKPSTQGWRRWLSGSAVDAIVRQARNIDVYVVGSEAQGEGAPRASRRFLARSETWASVAGIEEKQRRLRLRVAKGAALVGLASAVAWPLHERLDNAVLIMIYLMSVVLAAVRYGRAPAVMASILAVAAFDFFFVPPYLTFAVADGQYLITFAIMLVVALVISRLASGLRLQAQVAGFRERRMGELYGMSRELAALRHTDAICTGAMRHVNVVFNALSLVLLPGEDKRIRYPQHLEGPKLHVPQADLAVAQWVYDHGQAAGHGTDTLPATEALFLPLIGTAGTLGVLGIRPQDWERLRNPEQRRQLETFAGQIALALERVQLASRAEAARLAGESERLRNSLLAGISHDLRTPLATVLGAATTLAQDAELPAETRRELGRHIAEEAARMNELIAKVLDMARLETGDMAVTPEWLSLEEVVGVVLQSLGPRLAQHALRLLLPEDLGLIQADPVLLERVLSNLLENAGKYTPAGSQISLAARRRPEDVLITVSDNGPGLPAGTEQQVFQKFYRIHPESPSPGVGLGLTICRAVVEAHGGSIWAEANPGAGVSFHFTLPQTGRAPAPLPENGWEPRPASTGDRNEHE